MIMADFSKAFDTVRYRTLISKLHSLGFSKSFLFWLTSYLSDRLHFVQIDDRVSDTCELHFGVPQGSILGPMLFNLYVSDLQDYLPSKVTTFQYADDTTIYASCRPSDLPRHIEVLNLTLDALSSWSADSHLGLNPVKTKAMLLSTRQMSWVHSLDKHQLPLRISDESLERVHIAKLLGVYLHEHLQWDEHVKQLLKACYGVLSILRKIKNFTDFKLRKHLVETLLLSKIDYCDTVFYPLPDFLLKRLQRLQFAAGSFVTGRYIRDTDNIIKLGWLPIKERRDFHLLKLVYKALNFQSWPSYLSIKEVAPVRNLRSNIAKRLAIPLEKNTFQDSSAKLFNSLPIHIRNSQNFNYFCRETSTYLRNRVSINK